MRNTRMFSIRLRVQETFFKNFRCALGAKRQRTNNVELDRTMRVMQDLCGDIEMSLYAARRSL